MLFIEEEDKNFVETEVTFSVFSVTLGEFLVNITFVSVNSLCFTSFKLLSRLLLLLFCTLMLVVVKVLTEYVASVLEYSRLM